MVTLVDALRWAYRGDVALTVCGDRLRASRAPSPRISGAFRVHKLCIIDLLDVGAGLPGAYALASLHDVFRRLNAVRAWTEPSDLVRERAPELWAEQQAAERAWWDASERMRAGDRGAESEMLRACERYHDAWLEIGAWLAEGVHHAA